MATSSGHVRPGCRKYEGRYAATTQTVACLVLLASCSAQIDGPDVTGTGSGGAGPTTGSGGTRPSTGTGGAGGTGPSTGTGGAGSPNPGSGGGGALPGTGGDSGTASACAATPTAPARAPLRRLTRFEYNNTVSALLGDTSQPANAFPTELLGSGFGSDVDLQSVGGFLAEQYGTVAEGIGSRATGSAAALTKLAACAGTITATSTTAVEETCAKTFISTFLPRAYRRPITTAEADETLMLFRTVRTGRTFASAMSGVIEGILQSPDFLYRPEFGVADKTIPTLKRPTGPEMATRLSYMFAGTSPDDALTAAAASGELLTNAGVLAQATRLVNDVNKTRVMLRFFFDNVLPINGLTDLTRSTTLFPAFSPTLGAAMHEETQQFLEYEIYQGGGTWPSILTAPYTFVNEALGKYYGMTGVTGTNFRKVDWPDKTKRLGLLTQAGIMTGTITTNQANPVLRGTFIINKLMCMNIQLPTDPAILAMVKIPEDTSGATARERFTKHSTQAICATCHRLLDPMGFALENYDPVGQYRTQENGVNLDVSGNVPGTTGTINGPIELVQKLATVESVQNCFATHWMDLGYGRSLGNEEACTQATVKDAFKKSGYNVKQLLLALAQTDAFLYLPK
ncbi:MAG: DUF1592 domain-containing protein [Pseudomonadota bacterium]